MTSWMGADLPVHVVRYEDMITDPSAAFDAIIRFIGLGRDPRRLAQAIEHSRIRVPSTP